jgi:nucleolar protein 9
MKPIPLGSLLGQKVDDLIAMAHHAITSHVLDAFLTSSQVATKWKRKLLLAFDGRYLDLVCDKFGSRVGDTIWDHAADGFMKVSLEGSRTI